MAPGDVCRGARVQRLYIIPGMYIQDLAPIGCVKYQEVCGQNLRPRGCVQYQVIYAHDLK